MQTFSVNSTDGIFRDIVDGDIYGDGGFSSEKNHLCLCSQQSSVIKSYQSTVARQIKQCL